MTERIERERKRRRMEALARMESLVNSDFR